MHDVLKTCLGKFVVVNLDDILIYSKDLLHHTDHLRSVFEALRQQQRFAKLEKCSFLMYKISFLGFIINTEGIKVDPSKVEAITSWPIPTSITQADPSMV